MKFFIVTIILLFSVLNNSTLIAATVLGTGSGALLGNDLTDPEDNGVDSGTNGSNFNWTSINASSKKTFASEGSYSVFDNNVSGGSAKWCCDNPTQWIYVQLSQSYVLSHFTITSGNDVAGRDPDIWKIQGSNDGSNWTDIYSYSSNGNSPFSARNQVIKYTGAGDDFATPDSYSYFRYYVTSTVSGGHQINELEFFGDADSTAPTLSSSTPADNATGVAIDANIVLNFSESVDAKSGNITIKKTSDNSTIETIDVTSGQVTGSGTSQITINPSSNFIGSTEYYVLIDASAFDDSSSNSYAGISSTTDLSFTTINAVPTLSSSVPADDATGIERDANIVLNFSESVDAESGNITIKKTSDNSIVETIDVTSVQVTGSNSSQITVSPLSNFDADTEYYVLIDATAFDDSDSGSYAGISSTTALSFTVKAMVDPTTDKNVAGTIDAQISIAKNTFTQSVGVVSSRLSYLRQNRVNDNLSKNNIKLDFGNALLTSLTETVQIGNTSSGKLIPDDWSSWSEGTISMTKIGDTSNSSSKEIDSQGIAVGFDKRLNDNDLLGFAVQYGQSDTDIGTSGSGIDTKNYNISIYRTKPLDDNNFIEGTIGVGQIKSDLVRKNGSNTLTGSRDGNQIFGSINYGKTFSKKDFNLTPIGRIDLGYTELDAYTEIGTDALSYDKQNVESGLASLGLEINDIIKFNQSNLKPFGKVEYGLDFSNSSDAKMHYISDTSTTYTYTQGVNSTHLLSGEIGFNFESKENLLITTTYKRIQGSESEHSDTIKFGVNFKSKQDTEYAMTLDGSEDLAVGFDISKNIDGFDLNFNANQSLSENSDQTANISLSRSF